MTSTPAERARAYRDRRRGAPPREVSDTPLARALRKTRRRGMSRADLEPAELAALRAYEAERARARRKP